MLSAKWILTAMLMALSGGVALALPCAETFCPANTPSGDEYCCVCQSVNALSSCGGDLDCHNDVLEAEVACFYGVGDAEPFPTPPIIGIEVPVYTLGWTSVTLNINRGLASAGEVLTIANGFGNGTYRVTSARVKVNGSVVIDWGTIDDQLEAAEVSITLQSGTNVVTIENASTTSGYLTIVVTPSGIL